MNDPRMPQGDQPLEPLQGLQLLNGAVDAGVCTDGVCSLPPTRPSDSAPQQDD